MSNSARAAGADNALNPIFELETKLMADINVFNTKYSCYLHQNNNNPEKAISDQIKQNGKCSTTIELAEVNAAKLAVLTDIQRIQSAITTYNSGGTNTTQYDSKYDELIRTYSSVLDTRKDLDAKLAELHGTNDGIHNFYKNQYRATMFSKIMMTILVTSLVYYTFMKIIKK